METRKTRVSRIQVGDSIDFDAHTGDNHHYDGQDDVPVMERERVAGVVWVTSVERVLVSTGHRRQTAIRVTLEGGRSFTARGVAQVPVRTDARV